MRSTAADGSLTVVLFSDASNDIAADGFEAFSNINGIVSEKRQINDKKTTELLRKSDGKNERDCSMVSFGLLFFLNYAVDSGI